MIDTTCYFSLTEDYLGEAVGKNPGYLKLRKIRAAQNIARTVLPRLLPNPALSNFLTSRLQIPKIKYIWVETA